MKKPIAIVTYFSTGKYDANTSDENATLASILSDLGLESEQIAWSDPEADWTRYSCLLIKSTWDYFDYYEEFLTWLAEIEKLNIPVLNSIETLRWNSNKEYLLEIQAKGFEVIAGHSLEKGTQVSLELVRGLNLGDELVFKPKVSGGAKNTIRVSQEELPNQLDAINQLLAAEDFLVQPYISEVAKVGEYSLIYFNSRFSHAVLKTPASKDFRVQHYFGGTIQTLEPSAKMKADCDSLVAEFCSSSLYVRVDGVWKDERFHLMELEMIEPYLFLEESESAKANYKVALQEQLSAQLQIPLIS
ncbi:ATP-grasp domain-containing protein [Algoriphagus namhaensis]